MLKRAARNPDRIWIFRSRHDQPQGIPCREKLPRRVHGDHGKGCNNPLMLVMRACAIFWSAHRGPP